MFETSLFITLVALFYTFMPTYFFHQLFPFRFKSKIRFSIQMLCSFFFLFIFNYIKIFEYSSEMSTLMQLTIFLNIYLLFKGTAKQKLLIYFIFLFVSIFIEILSINIYLQFYTIFMHAHTYTALNILSHSSFQEKLFIELLIFIFSQLFFQENFLASTWMPAIFKSFFIVTDYFSFFPAFDCYRIYKLLQICQQHHLSLYIYRFLLL